MTTWKEFTESAPRIAAIFTRRHAATGNLCLLATLRSDGFPRISPIEPRIFEDQLWIVALLLAYRDRRHRSEGRRYISGSPQHCSTRPG